MSMRPTRVISIILLHATATTEFYTLSLHDALPIYATASIPARPSSATRSSSGAARRTTRATRYPSRPNRAATEQPRSKRSEEHTSELQSQFHLVCRLLLEKKKVAVHGEHRVAVVIF